MKKKAFIAIVLSMALAMTASSGCGKDPEPEKKTEEVKPEEPEEPVVEKKLTEGQPIPEDPGNLERKESSFESANLKLELPDGVTAQEGEPDDLYGYVTVTDDAGGWKIRFQPYNHENNLAENIGFNRYLLYDPETTKEEDAGEVTDNEEASEDTADTTDTTDETTEDSAARFPKKIDWSEEVTGTLAGFPIRAWANNIAGEPKKDRESEVPAVDILVDYGETFAGRYYGMYVRLEYQNPEKGSDIYELLKEEKVLSVLNNFSVIEAKEPVDYTVNGVTVSLPARWDTKAENNTIAAITRDHHKKSFVLTVNPTTITPEEQAAVWGDVITKEYGERTYSCAINSTGTEETPDYTAYLYTKYNEQGTMLVQIAAGVDGVTKEDIEAYLDNADFAEIMASIQIDSSVYTDTQGARTDDFKLEFGKIVKYTGTDENVVIPAEIGGYTVEGIGDYAFQNNTTVKTVTLPDTAREIGICAFDGCTNLESVVIPEGITEIGYNTFNACGNLKSITLPESLTTIGEAAFKECASLENVILPSGVTSVEKEAFSRAGTGSFEAKGGAVYGEKCFELSGFDSMILADGSDLSAYGIFRESKVSTIQLPSDLTALGEEAFNICNNITELTLPDTVTSLGVKCFSSASNLRKLTLSKSLTALPADATFGTALVSLSIPASVTSIDKYGAYADMVFLYNKDVQLADDAILAKYLYLNGAHTSEDIPKNMENQTVSSEIHLSADGSFEESNALDNYYESLGMERNSWFGPSEALSDKDIEDYVVEDKYLTSYTGDKKLVFVPECTANGDIIWLKAGAFAGNTTVEGISLQSINSIEPHSFEGCTNLKKMWFGMCSFSYLDKDDDGIQAEAFAGIPEGITVYFPAGLTEEEFQNYERIFKEKGMPESTIFERYTLTEEGGYADLVEEAADTE